MWIVVLITLLIPAFLLLMMAVIRQPDRISFVLNVLALGSGLLLCWVMFPWHVSSLWVRWLLPLFFIIAVVISARRIRPPDPPRKRWVLFLNGAINVVVIVFLVGLTWRAMTGYLVPEGAVVLESPLKGGWFVVGHGGASPFINGHARVNPQNHALDILALNRWGSRARPFGDPKDLTNYLIFGVPLYAPCSGKVLVTVDGLEDLVPGKTDRKNLAGNHVLLECQGVEVVLAHMQNGSVRVSAGQTVSVGDPLGKVGNSGNTSEPHLHMHAERGGNRAVILEGSAVAMLIDGQYLVRGDVFGQRGGPE